MAYLSIWYKRVVPYCEGLEVEMGYVCDKITIKVFKKEKKQIKVVLCVSVCEKHMLDI